MPLYDLLLDVGPGEHLQELHRDELADFLKLDSYTNTTGRDRSSLRASAYER